MKNADFEITRDTYPDSAKFTLTGNINAVNAFKLQYKLEEALKGGQVNIVLNMSGVEYLSSTGIRLILKNYKDAIKKGGKLAIETPSEYVRQVMSMTALDDMLIHK